MSNRIGLHSTIRGTDVSSDNENLSREDVYASTKKTVLFASIKLFSQHGYNEVSMRDIAEAVGIKASSIYNHFESKKSILDAIFKFYDEQWKAAQPDVNVLLRMAETEPPDKVMLSMLFDWSTPELQDIMNRIYVIASREAMIHQENIGLLKDLVMDRVKVIPRLLLGRLMELGKIEPIDVEAFVTILSHVSHSSTALNHTPLRIELETWIRCWGMLMSIIKPTGK